MTIYVLFLKMPQGVFKKIYGSYGQFGHFICLFTSKKGGGKVPLRSNFEIIYNVQRKVNFLTELDCGLAKEGRTFTFDSIL